MDQEQYDEIFSDLSTGKLRYSLGSYPQYVVNSKEGKLYYKPNWYSSRKVCSTICTYILYYASIMICVGKVKRGNLERKIDFGTCCSRN